MPLAAPPPDLLVMGGGGVLGEAWMNGVLAGLEDGSGVDFRDAEGFVGTSAGSIVAASLVSGSRPRRPGAGAPAAAPSEREDIPEEPASPPPGTNGLAGKVRAAARVGWAVAAPLVPAAVALGAPAGALARSALLSRVPPGERRLDELHRMVERSGARFDGRLRVCCVDRHSGRRVVFGAPGTPAATVADAVVASCSIPWVFRPVEIGGREYVDGGAWSVTNVDAAPAGDGSEVLLLEPTALPITAWRTAEGALRAALSAATAVELQVLRARGAHVRRIVPDEASARIMSGGLMRRGPAEATLAAAYRQGLALGRAAPAAAA